MKPIYSTCISQKDDTDFSESLVRNMDDNEIDAFAQTEWVDKGGLGMWRRRPGNTRITRELWSAPFVVSCMHSISLWETVIYKSRLKWRVQWEAEFISGGSNEAVYGRSGASFCSFSNSILTYLLEFLRMEFERLARKRGCPRPSPYLYASPTSAGVLKEPQEVECTFPTQQKDSSFQLQ